MPWDAAAAAEPDQLLLLRGLPCERRRLLRAAGLTGQLRCPAMRAAATHRQAVVGPKRLFQAHERQRLALLLLLRHVLGDQAHQLHAVDFVGVGAGHVGGQRGDDQHIRTLHQAPIDGSRFLLPPRRMAGGCHAPVPRPRPGAQQAAQRPTWLVAAFHMAGMTANASEAACPYIHTSLMPARKMTWLQRLPCCLASAMCWYQAADSGGRGLMHRQRARKPGTHGPALQPQGGGCGGAAARQLKPHAGMASREAAGMQPPALTRALLSAPGLGPVTTWAQPVQHAR